MGPDGRRIVAICDDNLLGKRFEEGNLQLDITGQFYKGDKKSGDDLIEEIKKGSCHLNIVGESSIEFCLKKKFIEKEHIIDIGGVPHAQAVIILDD